MSVRNVILAGLIIAIFQGNILLMEHLQTKFFTLISRLFQGLWW